MLAFAAGISLSARADGRASKRRHEHELDVALLQDSALELEPHLYERGHDDLVKGRQRCHDLLHLL
jgi:hypothetical protein